MVKPSLYENQNDRSKRPLYSGVCVVEVGIVLGLVIQSNLSLRTPL